MTEATRVTVGASGAIFGLFAAAFVIARGRGLNAIAAELGVLLLINLAFTFGVRDISIGGHLGGLAGGVLCAFVIVAGERGALGPRPLPIELIAIAAVGALSIVGGIAVA
jgi:membrane associated rhomboid family serine protease